MGETRLAEGPVGKDPGVVVHPTVALGLADDRNHPARFQDTVVDEPGQLGGIRDAVDRDLADLDGFWHRCHLWLFCDESL